MGLENERLELTRQLGDRVAELANSQRILRDAEVRERSLNEKLNQLETKTKDNEKSSREDAAFAREAADEAERTKVLLKAAEREGKKLEERVKTMEEELTEARKEMERTKRGTD